MFLAALRLNLDETAAGFGTKRTRVQVEPLKNLFQAGGVRTELVFISSCSSEMSGKAFVEAGVPHVVAVKREESVTGVFTMLMFVVVAWCLSAFVLRVVEKGRWYIYFLAVSFFRDTRDGCLSFQEKVGQCDTINSEKHCMHRCCGALCGRESTQARHLKNFVGRFPAYYLVSHVQLADQAAQQFANQFYDALMSDDGRYTVRQAFEIALNTVNADNPNAPPQGDHFLLLPPGLCLKEWAFLRAYICMHEQTRGQL